MITTDIAEGEVIEKKPKGKRGKKKDVVEDETIEETFIAEEEEMPADRKDPRYAEFRIKKIIIAGGRELHLEVMKSFENTYTNYMISMVVNLDALDWRIEQKKKEKQNYESQNQMDAFEDMKRKELEEYDHRIEQLMAERNERIAQCPKISFAASAKSYAKSSVSTALVLSIPKDIIAELNDKIDFSDNYKIELIKNIQNE